MDQINEIIIANLRAQLATAQEENARLVKERDIERNTGQLLLKDALARIAALEAELALNAKMLARQTDLAREAESMVALLRREVMESGVGPF